MKAWDDWINLKGVMLIDPALDYKTQRGEAAAYSKDQRLVSDLSHYAMTYLAELCKGAYGTGLPWWQLLACSFQDTLPEGNPIYPMFNYRNINEDCDDWFTCSQNYLFEE
jgi:hypothetical protein